ncbi:hypothetical protein RBSH_02847 [Rhodopirellula baltica SH28]|uniref:Uncharacterized protein n=1 Tax=Rhodopirellula baltica SH28 TaxID=993517 RepID=K5DG90_RHOBT|nr:hypothetical protein RBSH_02847 [Rhodopirellula baltica SH28]
MMRKRFGIGIQSILVTSLPKHRRLQHAFGFNLDFTSLATSVVPIES